MNCIEKYIDNRCTGCNCCSAICSNHAISIETNRFGVWYPQIDLDKCTGCGLCTQVCPIYGKKYVNGFIEPVAFAGWNLDEEIRKSSSSGGIFTAIADYMIQEYGTIVYGAAYVKDFLVEHIRINTIDELDKLRGSKYVQSYISKDIYNKLLDDLKAGHRVLFSGTPCQTAAVSKLVSRICARWKENLFTVDVLCHGVPSPKAWEAYLSEICSSKSASLVTINMRDKSFGWHKFHIKINFSDGTIHDESFHEGIWGPAFFTNLFLRDCCYACNFKEKIRQSDISLGDFWGAAREEELRKFDDHDKGTSVILVNSKKGAEIIESVHGCRIEKVQYECLLKGLYVLYKSSEKNYYREKAFRDLDEKPFSEIVIKALNPPFMYRLKRKIKKIMKITFGAVMKRKK